jgi:hypothetical protein
MAESPATHNLVPPDASEFTQIPEFVGIVLPQIPATGRQMDLLAGEPVKRRGVSKPNGSAALTSRTIS